MRNYYDLKEAIRSSLSLDCARYLNEAGNRGWKSGKLYVELPWFGEVYVGDVYGQATKRYDWSTPEKRVLLGGKDFKLSAGTSKNINLQQLVAEFPINSNGAPSNFKSFWSGMRWLLQKPDAVIDDNGNFYWNAEYTFDRAGNRTNRYDNVANVRVRFTGKFGEDGRGRIDYRIESASVRLGNDEIEDFRLENPRP